MKKTIERLYKTCVIVVTGKATKHLHLYRLSVYFLKSGFIRVSHDD
jgi:hypothetical protein